MKSLSLFLLAALTVIGIGGQVGEAAPPESHSKEESSSEECNQMVSVFRNGQKGVTYAKRKALEHCILDFLREEHMRKEENETLYDDPPVQSVDDKVVVTVNSVYLVDMFYSGSASAGTLAVLVFDLSWNDPRLIWSPAEWELRSINIEKPETIIWIPYISKDESDIQTYASQSAMSIFCNDANVTSDGHVTCRSEPTVSMATSECSHNLHNFPNDEVTCCISFTPKEDAERIQFSTRSTKTQIRTPSGGMTEMKGTSISVSVDELAEGGQLLEFCISGSREQNMLRIEVGIPMAISAIVALASTILPKLKLQMLVKLFALLLQFLCFQFLFASRPELLMAEHVPKVHRFYEFTIITTIISLVLTFVVSLLMNCETTMMPPPRSGILFANVLNGFCGCIKPKGKSSASSTSENADASEQSSWNKIWLAFHNGASVLLVIVYILGFLIIAA